jgi:glycerol kinase
VADITLLSIDQGTTSSRAILFNAQGVMLDVQQKELTLHYPGRGWVEQNPEDIWADTLECCKNTLSVAPQKPAAIGITNQRETTIIWDRATGEPVYNAIVWQDRRTADYCAALRDAGHEDMVTSKTGLLLDPYFSATKVKWILDNVDGVRARAQADELAFGTVDCWLLWKLTGGRSHMTDVTNAARTMLYNIVEQKWDEELLELFDIPASLLPDVADNAADFGGSDADVLGTEIPITGMAGDQHAALIGQGCVRTGMMKATYGTGCFALMNIGADGKVSENRLLTTVAYRVNGEMVYALEGSIFIAGAVMQWLRDGLGIIETAAQSEALAESVEDNNGVYFVPAFTGLGAPHWRPDARGIISGLGRETTKAHIVRAALEAQGYQTRDLMSAMAADGGAFPDVLRVDGGLVANRFMCQFLADMLGSSVELGSVQEATAWGAAALAGLHIGVFDDLDAVGRTYKATREYTPNMAEAKREALYGEWGRAVSQVLL